MHWFYLGIAIVAEVIATSTLKTTSNFTRLWPSLIGVGIVLVALMAWLWHKQALDLPAIIGMALIVTGVIVMNLFSSSIGH